LVDAVRAALCVPEGAAFDRSRRGCRAIRIALLDHPDFAADYDLVVDAPYHAWPGAVFIRRDYLETLPLAVRPVTIDVRATSLY
jgi:hypothetical protein